jgi:hypothetical protein
MAGAAASLALIGTPAAAAVVADCGDYGQIQNVVEPWETSTRTYYAGRMRVVLIDTGGEPACCSSHLVVLYTDEPPDEPAYTACKLVSDQAGRGFAGIDFKGMKASYDPKRGVLLTVRASRMKPDGSGTVPLTVKLRLKASPPSVAVER